jgi:hypothetical protein
MTIEFELNHLTAQYKSHSFFSILNYSQQSGTKSNLGGGQKIAKVEITVDYIFK